MKKDNMEAENKYDLARWLAGEMDQDELTAFRNSPGFDDYERIAQMSRDFAVADFDENRILNRIISGKPKTIESRTIPLYRSNLMRVAAVLVIAIGLFFVFRTDIVTEKSGYGKTGSIVLPDHSHVELNSGSEIKYDKSDWNESRKLSLDGEAYFKVAKGKTFDVATDMGTVTVVGTQFNVKSRENRFEVECYEGKVKVTSNGRQTMLTPGMAFISDHGNVSDVAVSDRTKPAWTLGEIQFTSADLSQIASELERRFDIRIEIMSDSEKTLTGTFSATDFKETLELICRFYKLRAETRNNVVILSADE